MDLSCPLVDPFPVCPVDSWTDWGNGSESISSLLAAGLTTASGVDSNASQSAYDQMARSRLYNIFRRATVPHGFGSEYQSELRKFFGERWTDSWLIWALAMPGTFILGVMAQVLVKGIFGRLRMPERQHTRERLWNFAFYKFIFIFGVVNVDSIEEMIIWGSWFALLGTVQFFIVISRDRCEYMTFSPVPAKRAHRRIVVLLASIIGFALCVLSFSLYILWAGFVHTGLFTLAEALLILMPSWHILLRYGYHHLRQGKSTLAWEKRTALYYHLNIVFELGTLLVDLVHHLHMMLQVCNLSASSLVIVAQIRFLCMDFVSKFRRHRNYMAIRKRLQATYPSATDEEIKQHDGPCSICWDTMEQARKLHCGHIFHESCLLSWLEQDVSCPICRTTLTSTFHSGPRVTAPSAHLPTGGRFFFPGARINRYLPNISVTVSHPMHDYLDHPGVDIMAEQVQQVFPNISHHLIIRDLLETGSTERTIDNILNGTLYDSGPTLPGERDAFGSSSSSSDSEDEEASVSSEPLHPQLALTGLSLTAPGGGLRAIPDTPEACRALQIQRRETLVYEARKKFLAKMAMEKAQTANT
ncbi:E3 ubiquitin-protein ligase AMFR-like [Paramacrobiotus metropolitanus]|uniref:E3 ubiquitin-protein ligase AMFR-like n=1 Tax=Paramacrobiotus metropolitanus TaxID=2943436 RepID=UPI002445F92B|nr:E3 ubiquitin-protein ligase AMFR-like [Paramacrobiotus metropolitanus]